MLRKTSKYLILIGLLTGCVQSFDFESSDYEKILVVDGLLTTEEKIHTVRLNYTKPVNVDTLLPLSNANVTVLAGDGTIFSYSEISIGFYRSDVAFEGIPGENYQLQIVTDEGKTYQSGREELLQPTPVDSITTQVTEFPSEELGRNELGVQFFVNADPSTHGGSSYFRFDWNETFQIRVPRPSLYKASNPCNASTCSWELRDENIGICYQSNQSIALIIGTTIFNSNNRLTEVPLRFASLEGDLLRNRYSIEATMYAINQEAYLFYSRLKEVNESGGSLFDNQQGAVIGNMRSITNPDEPVLGFFEVSGVSKKRQFFEPQNYGPDFTTPDFRFSCSGDSVVFDTTADDVGNQLSRRTNYQIIYVSETGNQATLGHRTCTDCTWYASNVKPDFWID